MGNPYKWGVDRLPQFVTLWEIHTNGGGPPATNWHSMRNPYKWGVDAWTVFPPPLSPLPQIVTLWEIHTNGGGPPATNWHSMGKPYKWGVDTWTVPPLPPLPQIDTLWENHTNGGGGHMDRAPCPPCHKLSLYGKTIQMGGGHMAGHAPPKNSQECT